MVGEINVRADDAVDFSLIPVTIAETVVEDIASPATKVVALMEQPNIPVAETKDIVVKTSTHDFQQAMEGDVEIGEIHLASPIRFLVGGVLRLLKKSLLKV